MFELTHCTLNEFLAFFRLKFGNPFSLIFGFFALLKKFVYAVFKSILDYCKQVDSISLRNSNSNLYCFSVL